MMKFKYRNSSYYRHFEDYTEKIVPKENGRGTKVELCYIGDYYQQEGSLLHIIIRRAGYLFLFALAAGIFICSAVTDRPGGQIWYLILTQAAVLLSLNWLLYSLLCYTLSRRKMTIGSYKSGSRGVLRASRLCTVCIALALIFRIIYQLLSAGGRYLHTDTAAETSEKPELVLFSLLGYAVSGILTAVIYLLETKTGYIKIPNSFDAKSEAP